MKLLYCKYCRTARRRIPRCAVPTIDMRYCPNPALNWWVNHHLSAFWNKKDELHYRQNPSQQKV